MVAVPAQRAYNRGATAYAGKENHMLKLQGIHWNTPEGEEILKGIDLQVPEKKLTVITGPNGG